MVLFENRRRKKRLKSLHSTQRDLMVEIEKSQASQQAAENVIRSVDKVRIRLQDGDLDHIKEPPMDYYDGMQQRARQLISDEEIKIANLNDKLRMVREEIKALS